MTNRWAYRFFNTLAVLSLPLAGMYVLLRWRRRVFAHGLHWLERWGHLTAVQREKFRSGTWWWVHAVSMGEVKAIETFLRQAPKAAGVRVLLSVVTPEALQWAAQQHLADELIAAPVDLPWVVRRVVRGVRPRVFISVESEFWPNLLRENRRAGAKVALINGRISQRSFKSYRQLGFLTRALWEWLDLFAVQQKQDADRFAALGVDPVKIHVTGNLKYDLAIKPKTLERAIDGKAVVVVVGSTREGEEAELLPAFEEVRRQHPELKVIWAPRHVDRLPEIEALFQSKGLAWRRKSSADELVAPEGEPAAHLLWDSMGDLLEAYRQADVAVVGGSFVPKGGQNPIEPAALELPVVFGPSMDNFRGVAENLVVQGGAWQVALDELSGRLQRLLRDPELRRAMGRRARQAVESEQGATERTLALLEQLGRL
jgi:3-deoxy-D-manno-octulosonic-acid transferase